MPLEPHHHDLIVMSALQTIALLSDALLDVVQENVSHAGRGVERSVTPARAEATYAAGLVPPSVIRPRLTTYFKLMSAHSKGETTQLGGVTGHGFKPGQSGNPGGRPKGLARTIRETCGGSPERLARVLLEIAENPKGRDRDRIAACSELLDRGWGKAPAFAAMEADDPLELSAIAQEIQGIADELAARRRTGEGAVG